MTFKELVESLESKIKSSYEEGVTLDEAEKLAGEFLYAQLQVSQQLATLDLDARMKKTGAKAIRAAIYMDAATKGEKKPTEAALSATVDMSDLVLSEQHSLDTAEVAYAELQRIFSVFKEGHIYFRGIAKGKFE